MPTSSLPLRRSRGAGGREAGQVLLIAILVLFGIATLAALFTGLVGAHLNQVGRDRDLTDLGNAANAGLQLANHQLLYGAAGADWRPGVRLSDGTIDNRPYRVGNGQVQLSVKYGPDPTNLQSRYLLITATATLPGNPFLSRTLLAVKQLLLTDYARFITDRFETRHPASLGVSGVELCGNPRGDKVEHGTGYNMKITGPVRSNTDLIWYGPATLNLATAAGLSPADPADAPLATSSLPSWSSLGILRDDRLEVSGVLKSGAFRSDTATDDAASLNANPLQLTLNGSVYAANVFAPVGTNEQAYYQAGFPDHTADGKATGTNPWRVLADLPTYTTTAGVVLDPGSFSVPRVQPPTMDAIDPDQSTDRYLSVTRDSGAWAVDSAGTKLVNSGANGWGWRDFGGIYIDNTQDIQYAHDLDKLRTNWVGSYSTPGADGRNMTDETANWWDRTGRYYAPPGVEIILHGDADCPYVEIIRDDVKTITNQTDGTKTYYYWKKPDVDGTPQYTTDADYVYAAASGTSQCPLPLTPTAALKFGLGGPKQSHAYFPFPPNGVIYAAGNVRIRGILPKVRQVAASAPTGYFSFATADYTATGGRNRRYDVTVVSGGTVYVEGDLLTPRTAGMFPSGMDTSQQIAWDKVYGTRIALLARDNVCVNTTALQPRPSTLYERDDDGAWTASTLNDAQPVYPNPANGYPSYAFFRGPIVDPVEGAGPWPTTPTTYAAYAFNNVRLAANANLTILKDTVPDLQLMLGHSAWFAKDGETATSVPAADANVKVGVALTVNGAATGWPGWEATAGYTFQPVAPADGSAQWFTENRAATDPFADGVNNHLEFLPATTQLLAKGVLTGADSFRFTPTVTGELDGGDPPAWKTRPDQLGYVLGPVAVAPLRTVKALEVRVEALVYAQNGSWFVLPGAWFNEDPDSGIAQADADASQTPIYHEPLNIKLRFVGAITENMPAAVGDVAQWTSRWSGPFTPMAVDAGQFLTYAYDPFLRWTTRTDASGLTYPRFPNLPVTSALLVWGERVSGTSSAGT